MKEDRRFTTAWGKQKMLLHITSFFPPDGLPEALFWLLLPSELQHTAQQMLKEHYLIQNYGRINRSPLLEVSAQAPPWNAVSRFAEKLLYLLQYVAFGKIDEKEISLFASQQSEEDAAMLFAPNKGPSGNNRDEGTAAVSQEEKERRTRLFHRKTGGALCILTENLLRYQGVDPWVAECAADYLAAYYHACWMYEAGMASAFLEIQKMKTREAPLRELIAAHEMLLCIADDAEPGRIETLEFFLQQYRKLKSTEGKCENYVR